MIKENLQLSDSVVYRVVSNELVLVELESGNIYHFSAETKPFIELFSVPRNPSKLAESIEPKPKRQEEKHITEFLEFLLEKNILATTKKQEEKSSSTTIAYLRPKFLRVGKDKLEDLNFYA